MTAGIGIDSVQISRIEELKKSVLNKMFHPLEIEECETFGSRERKNEFLAARFAAKEALVKALGCGLDGTLKLSEIRIVKNEKGSPSFAFYGKSAIATEPYRIWLSITHELSLATAMVVLEFKGNTNGKI